MSERRTRKRPKLAIEVVEDAGNWSWHDDVAGLIEAAAAELRPNRIWSWKPPPPRLCSHPTRKSPT